MLQRRSAAPRKFPLKITQHHTPSITTGTTNTNNTLAAGVNTSSSPSSAPLATVVRRKFGTSPFDQHWLNVDCCGLFCAGITYWLHCYGVYAVCFVLLPPWMSFEDEDGNRKMTYWGTFHSIAFAIVAFFAVMSHFKAMTTDPGAVPPDAEPVQQSLDGNGKDNNKNDATAGDSTEVSNRRLAKRLCRRCNAYKPDRAHHCSICKRCIIKMDHHCPWVNNCVGIGNHKYFLLFIFYTFCSCSYAMSLVIARFIDCIGHVQKHEPCLDKPTHLLALIGLVIESMLFGMFTCCMMIDQWDVVLTKVTHIDRLKGDSTAEDLILGVSEVFGVGMKKEKGEGDMHNSSGNGNSASSGGNFRPDWLSPFTNVCFPEKMRDEIYGFCRPCAGFMMNNDSGKKEDGYEPVPTSSSASGRRNVGGVAEIV
mmetsp:Transcript_8360/g.10576  ORF Transcript_8360/g.10576 Transcript_8360/m.10576 type:complete len:422 (-) Transcript_8360:190-1455(-)